MECEWEGGGHWPTMQPESNGATTAAVIANNKHEANTKPPNEIMHKL